jgi:adiponectin receptor
LAALIVTIHPSTRNSKNAWIFALSFIIAGYSTSPGLIHLSFYMDDKYVRSFPAWIFFTGGAIYAGGACIFALRWPERSFPFRFDNFGNSHNIFHICCVIGAVMTWWGSIRIFHERQLYSCPV